MLKHKLKSLSSQMSLIVCLTFIVLLLLLDSVTYYYANNLMLQKTKDTLVVTMQQNQYILETLVNRVDEILLSPCNDKLLYSSLMEEPTNTSEKKQELNAYFINNINIPLLRYFSSFDYHIYLSPDLPATKLYPSISSDPHIHPQNTVTDQDWFKKTQETNGSLYWYLDEEDSDYIYVAREIRGFFTPYSTTKVGIIQVKLRVQNFFSKVSQSSLTPNSHSYFTEDMEHVHPISPETPTPDINPSKLLASGNSTDTITFDRVNYMLGAFSLPNGWFLITLIPISDIVSVNNSLLMIFVCTALIGIFIFIMLSIFISRKITQPVTTLSRLMQQVVQEDNLQVEISTASNTEEISTLYTSFDTLIKRIQELLKEVYVRGLNVKEAEIKALQAQINPHFLYNTLDSISWATLDTGNYEIPSIISSLSNILRYSLHDFDKLATMEEELEIVRLYVNIQRFCYSLDITLVTDLAQTEPGKYQMPKLTLQPLVENAILHGMLDRGIKKDSIILRSFLREDFLIIQVENHGTADIEKMYEIILNPKEAYKHGIKNIHKRLTIRYGEPHGLKFLQSDSGGLIVEFSLPPVSDLS